MVELDVEVDNNVNQEEKYEVLVKNSGLIVSHRPLFTADSKKLLVVVRNALHVYSTQTFSCIKIIQTITEDDIANVALNSAHKLQAGGETVVICTVLGLVTAVDIETGEIRWRKQLKLQPKGWVPLTRIENFLFHSKFQPFFILARVENAQYPLVYSVNFENLMMERCISNVIPGNHSVALGAEGKFLVAIEENVLQVRDVSDRTYKRHLYGDRKLTCVSAHPNDWVCATGDDTGRVVLWKNPMHAKIPARIIFHWHTLPVQDISFSVDGTQILSGGGECTLVKWDANDPNNRRTIPRLGLPLRHICVSPRNNLTAISQADNSIKFISRENVIQGEVRNLVQAYVPESSGDSSSEAYFGGAGVYASGIQMDPLTQALVMNGKPGQLQCYSVAQDKYLYDLDITQQNYITSERNKAIPFSNVTHAKFSNRGTWLVTVESRRDGEAYAELKLKFWKFENSQQRYKLNTSIDWPHENGVVSLTVQQTDDFAKDLLVATSGGDKRFKTWGLVHDTSIHGKSEWWNCENVGSHRNYSTGPATFSSDGSILGVAFDQVVTLWKVLDHELAGTLSHTRLREPIRLMEFGKSRHSHLILCCSENVLFTWDIISHSLVWVIPINVVTFTIDLETDIVAAFSSANNVYIFPLNDVELPVVHKDVSKTRVISSIFSPSAHPSAPGLRSTLIFLNSSQELRVLVPKVQETSDDVAVKFASKNVENLALTPFAQLMATKTVNQAGGKNDSKIQSTLVGQAGISVIREVINSSPYTMPSMSFYSEQLLNALTPRKDSKTGDSFSDIEKHVLQSFDRVVKMDTEEIDQQPSNNDRDSPVNTDLTFLNIEEISANDVSWIDAIVR